MHLALMQVLQVVKALHSTWWDFCCNSFRELYWINASSADNFASSSETSPADSRTMPQKMKQGAKREGRRVGCKAPAICTAELQGPLSCLQIKGSLDSSHQTPSSRTPPFISSFAHPPKRGHYADLLHNLFPGVAAMEGSGSTWRPGTSGETGRSSSGATHGAAAKSEIV